MKLISWNVNGINALLKKDDSKFLKECNADAICLQEMKTTNEKMPHLLGLEGYLQYNAVAEKKGYSGTTILTKIKPLSVIEGMGTKEFDIEGRTLTLEFEDFYLVNTYFPNAQPELKRIDYKIRFDKAFLKFCKKLEKKKPVVMTGDFNVAHKEIDLKNPKANVKNAGFSPREREWFDSYLKEGFIDTFREFEKGEGHYTWWTYRFNARANNVGWRIDYFIVSEALKSKVKSSSILKDVMGSDHCPVVIEIRN